MTPEGTSNELDVQNEWEENTHTHTHCTKIPYVFKEKSEHAFFYITYCTAGGPQLARLPIPPTATLTSCRACLWSLTNFPISPGFSPTTYFNYSCSHHFRYCCVCVCVCFLPIHSGHQVRWTYQPGSHRRKVTQDFSSTFLRCVP